MRLGGCARVVVLLFLIVFAPARAQEQDFSLALPTNAHEATEFARELRIRFDEAALAQNIDPKDHSGNDALVLLIEYENPEVANNVYVQEALTKLTRKGYRVVIQKSNPNEEALTAINHLEKNSAKITSEVIGHVYHRAQLGTPTEEIKQKAQKRFQKSLDELKVFFGLRRGITLFSFVKPFLDEKTGIRKPRSLIWHTFKTQFPLIIASSVSAFYGTLHLPQVVDVMGDVDFFNWTYHLTYWTIHSSLTGNGHALPLDPLYFAAAAAITRLFWAFFDPSADANMRHGSRFNVHTNRTNIPYQYQMLSQFAHSLPGDLFIVIFGYELSRVMTGITIPYHHLLFTVVPLVSLSGSLAKNLPKSILFQMMDAKLISEKGQNLGNTFIGLVLSYMKTMKVVHSGGPFDPYYWFTYLGILYAAHTTALNKSESYRSFVRGIDKILTFKKTPVENVRTHTEKPMPEKALARLSCLHLLR